MAVFTFFCANGFAAVDQDITDAIPSAQPAPQKELKEAEYLPEPSAEKLEVSGYADLQQGYDNNVELDSQRLDDGFLQFTGNLEASYPVTGQADFEVGTDLFSLVYYTHNRNNIFDLAPYAQLVYRVTPDLIWRNTITFDHFEYPNEKESTYNGIYLTTNLRHFFLPDVYQEARFEYLKRWYPDRKTFNSAGFVSDVDRTDDRIRMQYNIGAYFNKFFIGVSNQISHNDSNDDFQQYYDYWLYRLSPSMLYFITDHLYLDVSLVYRYTRYKDRRSTEDTGRRQRDNTYIFYSSLYYDITKNLTLGVTYSYSENASNDPFQDYSGSIVSGGLYYYF
ncbi:MAG: hypothetical protein GF409_05235 [Candidatus Omnitrophica bacterium]|nr:hypothetical protein [Candidatus Omnitrophota bacterium]